MDNTTNEAAYNDWHFTSKVILCAGMFGLFSNGLLIWLLRCTHINNILTANHIRINLAVFQMFYDILLISRSIIVIVLKRELIRLGQFCIVFARIGIVFALGSVLNYLMLAALIITACVTRPGKRSSEFYFLEEAHS